MPLTKEEFDAAVNATCPMCAVGSKPRQRADTGEFVHDYAGTTSFSHSFCLASGLRKTFKDYNGQP